MIKRALFLTPLLALLSGASPALARPDLRQPRAAGPLTVYPDDTRRNLFFYPPGDLEIGTRQNGEPDVRLLHARYTGSAATADRGLAVLRSIFSLRLVMAGPTQAEIAAARAALKAPGLGTVELRPLPIRRLDSALVYATVAPTTAGESAPPQDAGEQPLPPGHFEAAEGSPPREGYWTERIYTLGLGPEDAQLLSTALERGGLALTVGYAFFADGIGPDRPLEQLSGSAAVVAELGKLIDSRAKAAGDTTSGPHMVKAGAVGVTADVARWPGLVQRVDINDSAPPGYAALDIYCYDFNQVNSPALYEKQVEIEAQGVGGQPARLTATFSRAQPDLYARSVRFQVAVRLDRPYRFRVVEVGEDGTSRSTPWRERTSWAELLDVTTQEMPR